MGLYTAIHIASWANVRYRLPVDAILILFAGLALATLWQQITSARSNVQTFKRSNVQTFKRSNVQTFKRSNVQTFKRSNVQTFKRSNVLTF